MSVALGLELLLPVAVVERLLTVAVRFVPLIVLTGLLIPPAQTKPLPWTMPFVRNWGMGHMNTFDDD